jgi:hypothetical protein
LLFILNSISSKLLSSTKKVPVHHMLLTNLYSKQGNFLKEDTIPCTLDNFQTINAKVQDILSKIVADYQFSEKDLNTLKNLQICLADLTSALKPNALLVDFEHISMIEFHPKSPVNKNDKWAITYNDISRETQLTTKNIFTTIALRLFWLKYQTLWSLYNRSSINNLREYKFFANKLRVLEKFSNKNLFEEEGDESLNKFLYTVKLFTDIGLDETATIDVTTLLDLVKPIWPQENYLNTLNNILEYNDELVFLTMSKNAKLVEDFFFSLSIRESLPFFFDTTRNDNRLEVFARFITKSSFLDLKSFQHITRLIQDKTINKLISHLHEYTLEELLLLQKYTSNKFFTSILSLKVKVQAL